MAIRACVAWAIGSLAAVASAQPFPLKPIRMLTSAVGGGTDFTTRLVAHGLTNRFGVQVIVDNRPSGTIIGDIVAKAAPDGYTMFLNGSAFWLQPYLQANTPYDPVRDFSPIILATSSPNLLVVHAALPVHSVKELIALAKAKPGELNYGSSSAGTPTHLGAELFKAMTGTNIVRVSYKGNGPALNALIGGEVQLMFANAAAVSVHVNSGRLRALAVASSERTRLVPGLPTVAEAGLAGYESASTYGVFGPAKMPRPLVDRLNREIVDVLGGADAKERLFRAGIEVIASSPGQLASAMRADMARMGKVIKDAGIRADF
jgi:tripartite-type tricarboxylate transporter receptor subunit TctC